ncbi:MAG: hypothetical protein ABSG51_11340 [Terracidiphilus sp.]|jgi:hypothetical protein
MIQRLIVLAGSIVFASMAANGQMVSNSAIQNDPAKEALCAKRAGVKQTVPFLIDQAYVNNVRAAHPDTTFIAEDGIIPELIECRVSEKTGVFELDALSSEVNSYWHLVRPEPFVPGNDTANWQMQADNACFKAAREKVNRQDFDHSFGYPTDVNVITLDVAPWYRPGVRVAGAKAGRYDVAVVGKLFYKASGADLTGYRTTCLLSPALEVKAVQTIEESADGELKMETRFEVPFKK